MAEIAKG